MYLMQPDIFGCEVSPHSQLLYQPQSADKPQILKLRISVCERTRQPSVYTSAVWAIK